MEVGYTNRPLLWKAVFTVFLNDQKDERKSMLIKFKSGANFPKYWKTVRVHNDLDNLEQRCELMEKGNNMGSKM